MQLDIFQHNIPPFAQTAQKSANTILLINPNSIVINNPPVLKPSFMPPNLQLLLSLLAVLHHNRHRHPFVLLQPPPEHYYLAFVLGFEYVRVQSEFAKYVVTYRDLRPLLGLNRVDLRRHRIALYIYFARQQQFLSPPKFKNILVFVRSQRMSRTPGFQRMYDVHLRTISRHKFLTPRQTPLPVILPTHYIYLPSQLANTEKPPLSFHRPHRVETLVNGFRILPFDDLPGCFGSLAEDVVAVVGFEEYRLRNPPPLVIILLREVYQFADIRKYLPLYPLHIFGYSVQNRFPGLLPEDVRHPVIVVLPLPVEREYLLQMLLEHHHHR